MFLSIYILSLIVCLNPAYVFVPVFIISCFIYDIICFPLIIVITQVLLLIKCPIYFLLFLSVFHIDFCVFILWRSFSFLSILQYHISKTSILAFSVLRTVHVSYPYRTTLHTKVLIRILLMSKLIVFVLKWFFLLRKIVLPTLFYFLCLSHFFHFLWSCFLNI